MTKAVMISIRPMWCNLIGSGKKTIEVRKTRPKIKAPFKCYIYCTQGKHDRFICRGGDDLPFDIGNGMVIGEFVCDGIKCITPGSFIVKEDAESALAGSCLTPKQAKEYAGWISGMELGKCNDLYAWHISDLKIYDQPKELNEFRKPEMPTGLRYENDTITRPPQNWCYVEELEKI